MKQFRIPEIVMNPKQEREFSDFVSRVCGKELSQILNPCYKPKFILYKQDFMKYTGLNDALIDQFRKTLSYANILIFGDKYTLMIMVCIIHFLRRGKNKIAEYLYLFLALKFYSSLVHTYMQFCNSDVWETSLANMSSKHLFKVKEGISPSIMYLSDVEFKKQKSVLVSNTLIELDVVKAVYALRSRLNQSMNSFSKRYYMLQADKTGIQKTAEGTEEMQSINLISDKIAGGICTYGGIDKEALNAAVSFSGMRRDLAEYTIKYLSDIENKEKLQFIVILMDRLDPIKAVCQEATRNRLVKRIASDRKIGNYSPKEEIKELLYSLENGYQLKTINFNVVLSFFSVYLTLFIRNRIC